ncbi:MAG: VOC family protein [Acidimicrobiales bacterium]|nr:VOC family protein [Acidimicrobiales bacterium]
MVDRPVFDHVAVAVHHWSDGFPTFIEELGGGWCRGGVAVDFAPCQLAFEHGMKVELLEPPADGGGFVARFLDGRGPGPHHITFKVPELDAFIRGCSELGLELLPDHIDVPDRREAFVHPKASGLGTLLQAIQADESFDRTTSAPVGFPIPEGPAHALAWVGLSVRDLAAALKLFGRVLGGRVTIDGSTDRGSWALVEWEPGRRLLVLGPMAARSIGRNGGALGVDHLLFTPPGAALPVPWSLGDAVPLTSGDAIGARSVLFGSWSGSRRPARRRRG